MAKEELNGVELQIPGEKWPVESIDSSNPPRKGECVEVGAKFADGERIDPSLVDYNEWHDAEYEIVLRGEVSHVKRHYHTSKNRNECSVYVSLIDVDYNDGMPLATE